jgi:virulence factor Mce-like protein
MKRILLSVIVLVAAGAFIVIATGASGGGGGGDPTYKVALDNAFGLVNGEQVKVAGVPAGKISNIDLPKDCISGQRPSDCGALVTVQVNQTGFGQFHTSATCESRPQSLIGEYFLNCDPGSSGPILAHGATIPVTHTLSTIPGDLLQDIMRMPYRERLTLIINELGAGVAGNSQNLQAALARAVPALTQTDNLLNLLANDSHTLQDLTASANSLVTELANNSGKVQDFIVQANNAATDTATQNAALKQTFHNLPGFLEQLKPALAKLGTAVDANEPALSNLNTSAGEIDRLLTDLPGFSTAARPALKTLGQASVTGKAAVIAAKPTVAHLNQFAKPTPELAQNLAIVLHDLDNRSRAVEPDPRSPGGQGYTGLEALLQYVFNQTLDLDYLGPFGHVQAIDVFLSPACSSYATPGTVANNIKLYGAASYRRCYSFLGPNAPGVNSPDPSNPGACVPEPGGEPPNAPATAKPSQTACGTATAAVARASTRQANGAGSSGATSASSTSSAGSGGGSSGSSSGSGPPIDLHKTIGQLLGAIGAGSSGSSAPAPAAGSSASSTPQPSSAGGTTTTAPPANQAQQLLNYLLSP